MTTKRDPKCELQLIGVHNNKDVALQHYSATGFPSFHLSNQAFSGPRRMHGHLQADFPVPSDAKTEYWSAKIELEEKLYNLKFVHFGRHDDDSDLYAAAFVEL